MERFFEFISSIIMQDNFIIALLSSIITFVITSGFTLFRDHDIEKKNRKNNRKKLAVALSSEIKAFKTVYDRYRLKKDPPQNGSDIKIVRLECNYVVTFDNNTDNLGLLDEKDISEIISFYMELKSLIDSLMVLATRWEDYNEFCNTFKTRLRNEILKTPSDFWTQGSNEAVRKEFDAHKKSLKDDVDETYEFAYCIQEKVLKNADLLIRLLEKYT